MSGAELSALVDRVQALEASVDDLLHGETCETTVTTTIEEPEIRVRIAHSHTLRDGWRCDSTTVEWTGRGVPDWDRIDGALTRSFSMGRIEAEARNGLDQEAKAACRRAAS